MAIAAASQLFGNEVVDLTNVEFQEALLISPNEPRRVRYVLSRQVGETRAIQVSSQTKGIESRNGNEPWTVHAAGQIECGKRSDMKAVPAPIIPEEVIKRCEEEITGSDFYLELNNRGYEYGVSFQAN
jgi:hypothetical protein